MSGKISNNSFKMNSDPNVWTKTPSVDTSVKLAGEEAKDRLYEPKHKKKLVRVLTVVAYVFFVSLAAIMLSLYYIFLWKGYPKDITNKPIRGYCVDISDRNLKETPKHTQEQVVKPTMELSTLEPSSPIPREDIDDTDTVEEDIESPNLPELVETNKGILSNKKFFYKNLILA